MTTFARTTHDADSTDLGLSGLAGRALRLAFHAMKMRSERAALQAMPDHLLKDLGISRSQIEHYTPMRLPDTGGPAA